MATLKSLSDLHHSITDPINVTMRIKELPIWNLQDLVTIIKIRQLTILFLGQFDFFTPVPDLEKHRSLQILLQDLEEILL